MSGIYYADKRTGKRTPIMPPPPVRTTRAQVNQDELNLKKAMGLSKALKKQAAPPKQTRRGRPRRRAASISSEESADGDVEEDSEGSDEGSEEEDDPSDVEEPVSLAPAHVPTGHETGLLSLGYTLKLPTPLDDEISLFDNMTSDDDDNDDVLYQKVEDISDYDDDEDERQDEDELAAVWEAEAEQDPAMILDQLDENSVYGFDADFDSGEEFVAFTSESDHPPEMEIKRRVHFSTEDTLPRLASESLSPVLTRTLLPSALPALDSSAAQSLSASTGAVEADAGPEEEDPYDTDATADNLPPEAHNATPATAFPTFDDELNAPASSPVPSPKRKKGKKQKAKPPRSKGPRAGTFIVDQDKPWGILDASGKRVVMLPAPDSQRHDWLDAKLRRDYDDPGSSTLGQLLDESDGSQTSSQDVMETTMEGKVDIMLAGLNSNRDNAGPAGQATGPSEAFYPPTGFQVAGDYVISQDELTRSFSDSDEGDIHIDIRNFISFDDDPSDEDESPTSPGVVINMPPMSELPGFAVNDTFPHLNNRNVTAFRRNADPSQAVLNTTPNFSSFSRSKASSPRPQTPQTGRKRKASNLPYQSPVYQGVTPVQRHVWHPTKRMKPTPRVDDAK